MAGKRDYRRNCLFAVLGILTGCGSVLAAVSEAELQNFLLSNYTTTARPRRDAAKTVELGLEFEISNIIAIDDKDQLLQLLGFLVVEWEDDYLRWNPADFGGIETVVLKATSIWLPDIVIINSVDALNNADFLTFRAKVDYDGKVTWSYGGALNLHCDLDLTFYPFDLQTCQVAVENWAYTGHQVHLYNLTTEVTKANFVPHGVWEISRSDVKQDKLYYDFNPGVPYPRITFTLYLKRKLSFYAINLMLPIMMLLLLNLSLFWLPPDSGEKVSYGVTIMLSFSVYQLILIDATPENSDYTPLLTLLVLFVMGISTFTTLFSVFILYIHCGKPYPVPNWLRCFLFRGLAKVMCLRNSVPRDDHIHDDGNQGNEKHGNSRAELISTEKSSALLTRSEKFPPAGVESDASSAILRAILENIRVQSDDVRDRVKDDQIHDEWKAVALVLDRFFFWLVLLVEVVFIAWAFLQQDPDH